MNPDEIWRREVEAQDTLLRLPESHPGRLKCSWPSILRDFADAVHAEETRLADGCPWDPSWTRKSPPAARAIDRMHEVWAWHEKYLRSNLQGAQVLQRMAFAEAIGKPLLWGVRTIIRKSRWTAYRIRDGALNELSKGLATGNAIAA